LRAAFPSSYIPLFFSKTRKFVNLPLSVLSSRSQFRLRLSVNPFIYKVFSPSCLCSYISFSNLIYWYLNFLLLNLILKLYKNFVCLEFVSFSPHTQCATWIGTLHLGFIFFTFIP
jgi:hypothetical protein